MASINDKGFSTLAEVLSERGLDGLGNAVEIFGLVHCFGHSWPFLAKHPTN